MTNLPRTNPDGSVTLRSAPSGPLVTVAGTGQVPNYAAQREWFIATGGDDSGPGTESDPLATGAELTRRISPLTLPEETICYYLNDMLPNDYLIGPSGMAPGQPFRVRALDLDVVAEVTITAAQAATPSTNPPLRDRVTVAGQPNWAASLQDLRAEVVTQPGVTLWLDKVDPADNTRAFISRPHDPSTGVVATLVAGDVLRFTRTRLIGRMLDLTPRASPDFFSATCLGIRVQDTGPGSTFDSGANLGTAYAEGCALTGWYLQLGKECLLNDCNWGFYRPSASQQGHLTSLDSYILGGISRRRQVWSGPGTLTLVLTTVSDTNTTVRSCLEVDMTADFANQNCAFWDWPSGAGGTAIEWEPNTFWNCRTPPYGLSANANTYGSSFNTGSRGHINGGGTLANRPNLCGTLGTAPSGTGVKDFEIGGTDTLRAALPAVNATNLTCFVTRFST